MAESRTDDQLIDVQEIGTLLRRRRAAAHLTLRDVEEQLDHALTASSLSRIENGAIPDPKNVSLLARWLDIPLNRIGWPGQVASAPGSDTPAAIEAHLRADKRLAPEAAEVLATMFRRLYEDLVSGDLPLTVAPRRGKRRDSRKDEG